MADERTLKTVLDITGGATLVTVLRGAYQDRHRRHQCHHRHADRQ
jgi:hypothetical protein